MSGHIPAIEVPPVLLPVEPDPVLLPDPLPLPPDDPDPEKLPAGQ